MNNNICLLTKDMFYKIAGSYPVKFIKYIGNKMNKFNELVDFYYPVDLKMPYFLIEGKYIFVYLNSLNIYLIPDIFKEPEKILNKINNSYLDLSNWEIEKVSDKISFIRNTYLRANHTSLSHRFQQGTYIITNKDCAEDKFKFFIYNNNSYDSIFYSYIGYDEMAYNDDDLIRQSDIFNKEQFYKLILINNGKKYILND